MAETGEVETTALIKGSELVKQEGVFPLEGQPYG